MSAERARGMPSMGHVATADGEGEGEGEGEREGRRGASYSRKEAPRGGDTANDNEAADEAVKAAKKAAASEAASKIAAARWEKRWESMYKKLLLQREKEGDEWLGVVRESQNKASTIVSNPPALHRMPAFWRPIELPGPAGIRPERCG